MILSLGVLIRALIGIIDLIVVTLILYVLSFLPTSLLGKWYRRCFRYWCWVFVRALRVDLKLHQKNQFPLPAHYIVIGNHPSVMEDLGVSALMDAQFLAKKEVQHWWIVGRIGKAAGTFYVDRESASSRKAAKDTLAEALHEGINIGLYPEGGCKGRRISTPFHYGVFDLSLSAQIPIVPLFLHYQSQEDFEWYKQHLLVKLWQIFTAQNRSADYYVFDAIDPSQFPDKEAYCKQVEALYLQWQKQYLV